MCERGPACNRSASGLAYRLVARQPDLSALQPPTVRDIFWSVIPRYVGAEHVEVQLARFDVATSRVERTLVHCALKA